MTQVMGQSPSILTSTSIQYGYVTSRVTIKRSSSVANTKGESQGVLDDAHLYLAVNKIAYSGFETQRKRHQKPKTGASVALKKDFKKTNNDIHTYPFCRLV